MPGFKAAVLIVALVILIVVPLLIRETYRLSKHDKPNRRTEPRAKTSE